MDFVFAQEDRCVDTNIEEVISSDEETNEPILVQKRTVETKSSDHSQHEVIRFETVKRLWDTLVEVNIDEDTHKPEFTTLNDLIAYNTCLQYGFVTETEYSEKNN